MSNINYNTYLVCLYVQLTSQCKVSMTWIKTQRQILTLFRLRPVRMRTEIKTNQMMQGGRFPHKGVYRVGHDNNGKLLGIDVTVYEDLGYLPNDSGALALLGFIDNGKNYMDYLMVNSKIR